MRLYSASGPCTSGTTNETLVELATGTTIRAQICEFTVGNSSTPNATDFQFQIAITRSTAAGSGGSSFTPLASDPAEIASSATCRITVTTEPTYASTDVLNIWLNQRATYRWVCQDGREIYTAATSGHGAGLRMVSAGQSMAASGSLWWKE